ncbi:urease accessory protein [Methylophilus rhizosphaerae]|uniref:Urease accessory protein n=1 Tax=Methylophilus rhizosphaerae TaxID=492660 RepID=A0A1G9A1M1_9PROT|nr:HupE/UreJ family protein [Methylophilus rhizosphaerae]SDK21258.1 urease accessory protein [Methylophilus rhizosphaerae]
MKKSIFLGLAASLLSGAAYAHPGHDLQTGFASGFLHPMTGWDHMLVMLSLGIWAARRPAQQGWQLPVLFVAVMAAFAVLAMVWLPMSLAEVLVAASVLVMGGLLLAKVELSKWAQFSLVGLVAAVHGYVHGVELGQSWSSLVGMVLATGTLHGLGWMLGRQQQPWLKATTQLLGGMMMGLGAYWLLA